MMRRLRVVVIAVLVTMAVPGAAFGITNGEVDSVDEYPFVGLLAFYDSDGEYSYRCSGTLITDTVMVTAAHCTDGIATAGSRSPTTSGWGWVAPPGHRTPIRTTTR